MALIARTQRVSGSIPTSSMADIAFLLLVFFLVTTVFDEQKGLPIVLPDREQIDVPAKNVLHILVQADGLVRVKRGESPRESVVRANNLTAIWRLEFAQNPNLIAAVKTAPTAPYRHMVDVLDALQAAHAKRISLQLLE